jgi:hypothetical protein
VAIPLPPPAEQKRIVAEMERRLSALARIEQQIKVALKQTSQLRLSLFHRALSGKLVKQRHTDEPASDLLQRIHAKKEEMAKRPKLRAQTYFSIRSLRKETLRMLNLEDIKPTHLVDILRQHSHPLDAKTLWRESQLSIDDFYAQLKKELGKTLKETGEERLLEAKS